MWAHMRSQEERLLLPSERLQPVHLECSRCQEQSRARSGSAPEPELRSGSGSAELPAELAQLSSEVCTQKQHGASGCRSPTLCTQRGGLGWSGAAGARTAQHHVVLALAIRAPEEDVLVVRAGRDDRAVRAELGGEHLARVPRQQHRRRQQRGRPRGALRAAPDVLLPAAAGAKEGAQSLLLDTVAQCAAATIVLGDALLPAQQHKGQRLH